MSKRPYKQQWWQRSPMRLRIAGMIVLALLISGSILLQNVFQTHAKGNGLATSTHTSLHQKNQKNQQSLKKKEGEWFQLSHFGSHHPAPDARIRALTQAKSMLHPNLSTPWAALGPRPINSQSSWGLTSGRITAEAVNPTNSKDIWVGAADGGLWHSTDGGVHWHAMSDSQPTLSVGSIAIDPNHPGTIYVGTGEANSNGDAYWGVGVLKSTNDGVHGRTMASTHLAVWVLGRL